MVNIGIVMVIEEYFKKVCFDGVVMFDDVMLVIVLIFCYDCFDNFWFVLVYELVYV